MVIVEAHQESHLMFELFNLAFEVTDVLGWVGVIELALDLSFFLLLAQCNSVNQCSQAAGLFLDWELQKKKKRFCRFSLLKAVTKYKTC